MFNTHKLKIPELID